MTKHRVTTEKGHPHPETEELERPDVSTSGMANSLMYATQAYLNRVAAFNGEVIEFVSGRWRHDVDLGQSLARCENWNAAITVQQNWARRTVQDYIAEAARLMAIASNPDPSDREPYAQSTTTARGRKSTEATLEAK